MCLPLGCLKCIVEIEAWIILLGGIGAFIYTIILQVEFSYFKHGADDVNTPIFGLLVAFWIFSSCMILNGIFGVVGGKMKNGCLLLLFNIVNIGIFLAFLVLMILGYVWAGQIGNYNQHEKCDDNDSALNQVQLQGEQLLCSSSCECYYDQQTPLPFANWNYSSTNTSLVAIYYLFKPTQVQQCPGYNETPTGNSIFYGNILGEIEKNNNCAGWCNSYPVMVFYNINEQPTNISQTCLDIVQNQLQDMGMLMGDISAGLMGLMGIMIIFTFCLCFHPTKQDMGYYQRLAYYDEA